jgi:hypothetical protein
MIVEKRNIIQKFEIGLLEIIEKYGYSTKKVASLKIICYSGKKLPIISISYNKNKVSRKLIEKNIKYQFEEDLLKMLKKHEYKTTGIQKLEISCVVEEIPIVNISYYHL